MPAFVQSKKPFRSDVAAQTKYINYRIDLINDFNGACGYCDDSDARRDPIGFHIDHFAPKKRFPDLETAYTNLVYACRFCNMSKSDHWIGNDPNNHHDGTQGFIDPCSTEYDDHIERDELGRIIGKTDLGDYVVKRLGLNLMRHQMLWNARRALRLRNEIKDLLPYVKAVEMPDKNLYIELLERYVTLNEELEKYEFSAKNG